MAMACVASLTRVAWGAHPPPSPPCRQLESAGAEPSLGQLERLFAGQDGDELLAAQAGCLLLRLGPHPVVLGPRSSSLLLCTRCCTPMLTCPPPPVPQFDALISPGTGENATPPRAAAPLTEEAAHTGEAQPQPCPTSARGTPWLARAHRCFAKQH